MTTDVRKSLRMDKQIDVRLGQVEIRQERLETTLESVVSEVTKIGTAVQHLDHSIQQIGKPNWSNLISATTMVGAMLLAFGGMFVRPIQIQTQHNQENIENCHKLVLDLFAKADEQQDKQQEKYIADLMNNNQFHSNISNRISRLEERVKITEPSKLSD